MGPEAIVSKLSPTTSEIINEIIVGSPFLNAALAKRPPLKAERCFLIALISLIFAPEANNNEFTSLKSPKVKPFIGKGNNAEPPPEIRQKIKSLLEVFRIKSIMLLTPFIPSSSGMG